MVEKKVTTKKTTAKKASTAKKTTAVKKVVATKAPAKKAPAKKAVRSKKYLYAVGRRKEASARVRVYPEGSGKIIVNGFDYKEYFPILASQLDMVSPLKVTGHDNDVDVEAKVVGGGKSGQVGAVRHGIARALLLLDLDLRPVLKVEGFLTRDPRVKERKKPGLRGARRAPQWSKR